MQALSEAATNDPETLLRRLVLSLLHRRDLTPEVIEAHAYLVRRFGAEAIPPLPEMGRTER